MALQPFQIPFSWIHIELHFKLTNKSLGKNPLKYKLETFLIDTRYKKKVVTRLSIFVPHRELNIHY
jgi:hypothetical protein